MPRKGIYSDVTFLTLPCCSWLHAGRQFREPFLAFAYNWEKGEDRNHELKRSSDERRSILHGLISAHEGKTTIWTNMCWGISAGSDCVHTIWEWSLANGMVVLAFVINVSVEKSKMRSMCFSFASVLKCASCAWDTETFLKEGLRLLVLWGSLSLLFSVSDWGFLHIHLVTYQQLFSRSP